MPIASPLGAIDLPRDTSPLRGLRIGWLGDLQGYLPMEGGLLATCETARQRFANEGAIIEPLPPPFDAIRLVHRKEQEHGLLDSHGVN